MRYIKIINSILFFFAFGILHSQGQTITGVVTSKSDQFELPGVSIVVKGTSIGTASDAFGKYSLQVPASSDTLVFSFVGYKRQYIAINSRNLINISLSEETTKLDEVVVTALGIKRDKKTLGYSFEEIDGSSIQKAKEISLVNSLSGRVAGLSISATNGGAASSSRIVLRGNNSLNNNQALVVIDGVPIDNSTESNSEDEWGGKDFGNGISDINSDDVETISVLKGASASALYGSKASNGVILITTKKGSKKGINVSFNSSATLDVADIQKDFQNTYGAGRNGKFIGVWDTNSDGIPQYYSDQASHYSSWGPKMEGQQIVDWDGTEKLFLSQANNYKDYFRNGYTLNNSISIDGGFKNQSYRLSVSDMRNSDIIPSSETRRSNVSLNANIKPIENLEIQTYISYVDQRADNRPGLSDNHNNVARNYLMMPRHISSESLENNIMDTDGNELTWYSTWNWMTNPYWNELYELSFDQKKRSFGNASVKYAFNDNLSFILRTALDYSDIHFEEIGAYNGMLHTDGSFYTKNIERFQSNTDFLLTYSNEINQSLSFTGNLGGNAFYKKNTRYEAFTENGLTEPYIYTIENSAGIPQIYDLLPEEKAINSLYYLLQFNYKEFLFMDLTGRNDWSSTLPKSLNSYFYDSYNLSFIFTELLDNNVKRKKILPFGKLRVSYSNVGNDTDPYKLLTSYYPDSNIYGDYAYIEKAIANGKLKPEKLVSKEIGTDLRFLDNRIALDFTYYHTNSYNQIISAPVSSGSGSTHAIINAGDIQNSGVEIQLKAKPIEKDNFSWNLILNYTKNNSLVKELTEGIDNYPLLEHWGLSIEARPGHAYGDIVGYGIMKDANGNNLVNENGLYERTDDPVVLGNINPDFSFSISNSFRYKNLSLSFLLDAKIGGEMFSGTNMYGNGYSGNFVPTLEGREEWYASEAAREAAGISAENWDATGGYLADGVYPNGTIINGADVSGQNNNTYVNPFDYWHQFAEWTKEIHEPFIYDASFIKLRELTISYNLPEKLCKNMKMKLASVSVIGRNLWLIYSKVPNVDPESFHTNGNGQGYELYSYPSRRSFGISLNFKF